MNRRERETGKYVKPRAMKRRKNEGKQSEKKKEKALFIPSLQEKKQSRTEKL